MGSATILGFATGTGEWGAYGTAGYWIRSASGVITQSLPATVTAVSCAEGSIAGLTAGDDRAMRIGPGSGAALVLQTSGGGAFTMAVTAATSTSQYILALRLIAVSGSRTYTIAVKSSDGATTYASGTSPDAGLGLWAYIRCEGSVRIDVGGSFPRYQGLLFDPVGGTTYDESAWAGLAIGADVPPSLRIDRDAWAGLSVGVASGFDPTFTLVESAWAGVDLGAVPSASLQIDRDAWAGLAIGAGDVVGEPIDPDAALPIASESSCLAAIRAALDATGEFDYVYDGPARDPRGRPADRLLTIAVEPGRVSSQTLGDDGPDGMTIHDATATLRVVVRADDPELRDAEARRLTAIVRNALAAQKLARGCWPDWTRVADWSAQPARDAERAVAATLHFRWHEDGWAAADVA